MSSVNKSLFSEKTSFFSFQQQKGRKISLFTEIRVSRKGQMFLKYRNRQWRSAIWPSIFMFNRKFPLHYSFPIFIPSDKKMKNIAPHGVGSSYSWYISMYNSRCLMIYPFLTFHLNSNWCSYPCILPLIFNIAWSFKSFVGRKENHCNLFYHVLGNSMRHVSLSNIAKKVQWDDFFKQSNVVILTEAQG